MTDYTAYWTATCVRGVIALAAGVVIAFCSALNTTILLLPLGIVFSLLALAAYVVVDSAIVLACSFMLPHHHLGRVALRIQGLIGMMIGIACFIVSQSEADIRWFLYLAALQSCCVAVAEYISARNTAEFHNSKWCYAASVIAALACVVLVIFHQATGHLLSWLLYSYLWCFGLNLFVLSCHMLFEEVHASQSQAGS
jgi:uncharacterized membrane protein HdeD (DUF308 family)